MFNKLKILKPIFYSEHVKIAKLLLIFLYRKSLEMQLKRLNIYRIESHKTLRVAQNRFYSAMLLDLKRQYTTQL